MNYALFNLSYSCVSESIFTVSLCFSWLFLFTIIVYRLVFLLEWALWQCGAMVTVLELKALTRCIYKSEILNVHFIYFIISFCVSEFLICLHCRLIELSVFDILEVLCRLEILAVQRTPLAHNHPNGFFSTQTGVLDKCSIPCKFLPLIIKTIIP